MITYYNPSVASTINLLACKVSGSEEFETGKKEDKDFFFGGGETPSERSIVTTSGSAVTYSPNSKKIRISIAENKLKSE